ncbi:RagB/SusD family nutrient uptake outer membrane protein [Parabacteroides sp. FAFU027]|uniref:RagB/SusD family nutrient uptake outer membrane protein n=1 Tax=Parabacteroides sp. FAFU027 TaxID=2922715 RepID=UPI001FB01927|nr:RagB/SusD family nutrient uptake outer membrane protein [Parabacteroides sp. FAFU027]
MKRIVLFLSIFGVILTSCKDYLDTEPTGSLTPSNSYASKSLITSALAASYLGLKSAYVYGQFYPAYENAPTDESFFFTSNPTYPYAYYNNQASDNSQLLNFWQQCYVSINNANTLLANIDASAAKGGVDTTYVRKAKGEALFLRSYYYFLLTQWFGGVPMLTQSIEDPNNILIERTPEKEMYDQIIADMIQSEKWLDGQTSASMGYSDRVTQDAVRGILARVFLYAAGEPVNGTNKFSQSECYHQSAIWASKLIKAGTHDLLSSYKQVFIDEAQNAYNTENIWEIGFNQFGVGVVAASGTIGVYCGPTHSYLRSSTTDDYDGYCYNYLRPHPRLFLSYEAGDSRRDWNIANYSFKSSGYSTTASNYYNDAKVPLDTTKLWSRSAGKWRREYEPVSSRLVKNSSAENFPVLRYADVLLMYAEALNEIDSTTVNGCTLTKFDAINKVRARAISTSRVVDHISWTTGTGYTSDPVVTVSGGGGSGAEVTIASQYLMSTTTNRTIYPLLTVQGSGYTTAPTVTIGNGWAANTPYKVGDQVAAPNGKLYTVTMAGTTTTTAPTNSSGSSAAATTGAVFYYVGTAAKAVAYLSDMPNVNLSGLNKNDFRAAIMMERYHELCFEALRLQDLRRWGILIPMVKDLANDLNATNLTGFYIKNADGSNSSYFQKFKWKMIIPGTAELSANDVIYINSDVMYPVTNIGTKDLYWPIPLRELNLNYKLTQNPGY